MSWNDIFDRYTAPMAPLPTGLSPSGKPVHLVKAVLFDVYGTLFISASGDLGGIRDEGLLSDGENNFPESRKAFRSLLADFGSHLSPEKLLRAYAGAIENEHHRLKKQGRKYPEIQVDRIWKKMLGFKDITRARRFALGFELIINPVYPMPHAGKMINKLREAGSKMGIISNAQFYTPLLFEHFCGSRPENMGFDSNLLLYSYQLGHAKPSTLLFDIAAEKLLSYGISPENTLFVGNDMRNDIFPAHRMGFQTALFAGDKRSLRLRKDDPGSHDISPHLIITDLLQLPKMAGF